ncbi:MAG: 3-hydroxybutyryl-CoA dehydrogenase [Granulosicoccus sp.]
MDSELLNENVIASVGAGRMGRGIAITFALAGYEVRLLDAKVRPAAEFDKLRKAALSEIQSTMHMLSSIGFLKKEDIDSKVARVTFFSMAECRTALNNADIIFEAVPETLEAKEVALALVSRFAQASAIVASTTSTILSDDLQPFVTHPGRFLNAHWLNPAFLIPLVEVSPARDTNPENVVRLSALLEQMGKVPVVCAASPGYIVPRIQALAMNEAARMVEEGVASVEDIDKATKYGFGFRFAVLGLLEFIDWGGGDILYYASGYMTKAMDDERYASPAIIERNMNEGRIGLRTHKGFLDYSSMDVNEYQKRKLAEFVALLRHIRKLPPEAESSSSVPLACKPELPDAQTIVQRYLQAMEDRELDKAEAFLGQKFSMIFPGGKRFTKLQQLVEWSRTRYQSISKTYERFDQNQCGDETVVYCFGTLSGVWLNGARFSGIRFIDRFVVIDGKISSQLVWNDLAECLLGNL